MIPIRDVIPTRTTPLVTWLVVALATFVFFAVQPNDQREGEAFLYEQAAIPCEVVTGSPLSVNEIRSGICSSRPEPVPFPGKEVRWAVIVSVFLHGGLAHLLGNMWSLWIFGNNVEDAFGHLGYAALYAGTGIIAAVGHILAHPGSTIPVVGASGAIAGVMGAYLVLYPRARVVSIVPPFFFLPFRIPAFIFLLFWLIAQFGLAGQATSIAWEAHVVGFAAGAAIALLVRRALRRRLVRIGHSY